jgi:hypothetical protein
MPFNFKTADGFYSTWKEGSAAYVKDEGRWKKVTSGYMKVNGIWQSFYVANKGNVKNLQSVTTNDDITFTWDAAEDIKEYQVWISKNPRGILTANYVQVDHTPSTISVIDNFPSNVVPTTTKIILQNGSKTVTGISTTFLSTLKVGNILYVTIEGIRTFVGVIASIQSNISLTLKNNWTGLDFNSPGIDMIYQTHNTYTYATDRESQYYFYFVPIDINNIPADQSTITSRTTPDAIPDIPVLTLGSTNPRTGSATLTWSPDSRAVRYALYWNSADGTNNLTLKEYFNPSPTDGEYTQTYTSAGNGIYKLAIAAINNIGEESAKSNVVNYTYSPYIQVTLSAPVLKATASSWDRATFTWAPITNAGRYELFVNGVSKGTVTSPHTLVGTKDSTYDVYIKAHGIYNANWQYTNDPVESNTKTLNTGHAAVTTTVRTDAKSFLNYIGTGATFNRYRYTASRIGPGFPWGQYFQSGPFAGTATFSFSPGTNFPNNSTTSVTTSGNLRYYDVYVYTRFYSDFSLDLNNSYIVENITTDYTSGGLSLSSSILSGNRLSATAYQTNAGTRPTVYVNYHYFTTSTTAGVNATIT